MPSRCISGRERSRRARRRRREAAAAAEGEARDWADGLGTDLLLAILGRVDHADILMSGDRVCRSWRRAGRAHAVAARRHARRRRQRRDRAQAQPLRRRLRGRAARRAAVRGLLRAVRRR